MQLEKSEFPINVGESDAIQEENKDGENASEKENLFENFKNRVDVFIKKELSGERSPEAGKLKSEYIAESLEAVKEMAEIPALRVTGLATIGIDIAAAVVLAFDISFGVSGALEGGAETYMGLMTQQAYLEMLTEIVGIAIGAISIGGSSVLAGAYLNTKINDLQEAKAVQSE